MWNVRGLNRADKRSEVCSFIIKNKISFCALLEVKIDECRWKNVVKSCYPNLGWSSVSNVAIGGWARIAFCGIVGG